MVIYENKRIKQETAYQVTYNNYDLELDNSVVKIQRSQVYESTCELFVKNCTEGSEVQKLISVEFLQHKEDEEMTKTRKK